MANRFTKVSKESLFAVCGYCRRICDTLIIREVIDLCVRYYHIAESFDPEHSYHDMAIWNEDDLPANIIYNAGRHDWSTILGKTIIKNNQKCSWNFKIIGIPKRCAGNKRIVIGIVPSDYVKTSSASFTFLGNEAFAYGRVGGTERSKHQFGNYPGDTMRMTLDLQNWTLSFDINGVKNVECIENIHQNEGQQTEYKLAVSLRSGRNVRLVSTI